jgi:hypothetical protein
LRVKVTGKRGIGIGRSRVDRVSRGSGDTGIKVEY